MNCSGKSLTEKCVVLLLHNADKDFISILGHVKLIIWFSDTAASTKNRPLACIYHQTKINTTVKKFAFKFSRFLT